MKAFLSILFVCLSIICSAQETGTIIGKLIDEDMENVPLAFVNVMVERTNKGTISDFDGNYKINDLQPGTYNLMFSYVGYGTVKISDIMVKPNQTTTINTALHANAALLDQVVIKVASRRDSPVALLLEQREAIEIKESIGALELAKLGIGDAATATTKISGVTASESSGDLYVRGLGDRYLYTTMNGLPIPSDDIERKNINLELFPTRVVQNISISKTYSPENYADQASGTINIQTRELLGKSEFGIGLESGVNTNVAQGGVWENFKQSPNMNQVGFGLYADDIPTRDALTQQKWDPESAALPINYKYSFTAGKRFGEKFEVLFTGSHSGEYEYKEGIFHQYRRNFIDVSFDDVREWQTTIETTALLNLGYEFNNDHNLKAVSFFINKLTDQVYEAGRNGKGFVFEETNPSEGLSQFRRDQNTKQTRLWVNQLIGEHSLGDKNNLDWALGYNLVYADEPNRIRNEINFNEDRIEFGDTGGFQQRKSYQKIDDRELNARLKDDFSIFENETSALNFIVGGNYRNKQRDFASRFFGVRESGSNVIAPTSLNQISAVFTPENFDAGLFQINDLEEDSYNATLKSAAGFAVINYRVDKFNFNIGARYQDALLSVDYNIGNIPGRLGVSEKSYNNIYPSFNVRYSLNEKNNLRLAASKTITLPEFKEIAPFEYVSPTGQVTRGNPDLEASTNYNLDLKWEFFPTNDQLISMTGFYKRIEDPINKVQTRGSAGVLSYFNSGKKAEIYGLELDANLNLIASEDNSDFKLDLGLNATRMWHSQDLKENRNSEGTLLNTFRYKNLTEEGLQGASNWIFNTSLNFSNNATNEFLATVSANYASDKIYALGAPEIQTQSAIYYNDAIVEKGFVKLNAIFSKELNENIKIGLQGKNLLNPKIERTQLVKPPGEVEIEQTVKSFRKGMVLSLSLNYTF